MDGVGDGKRGGARTRAPAAGRILDAASELFYREGIRAVGVDAIVERAGVAKMSLYKNFRSKDELVAAYLRAKDQRWRGWLKDEVEGRAGSPRDRISAVFDALGKWMESEEGYRGCAFINAFTEITDSSHPAYTVVMDQKRWMRGYFEELAADAGVGDPEELAQRLLILFEGATVTHVMQTGQEPIRQARETAETLIR